jgi:hypothetical protein
MLPKLSFGEQFPTSIRVMRGGLAAQRCHRAQATYGIHHYSSHYYFVFFTLFSIFTSESL